MVLLSLSNLILLSLFHTGSPLSNGSLHNIAGGELDYMEKMRGDDPGSVLDDTEKSGSSKRSKGGVNPGAGAGGAPRDTSRKGRSSGAVSGLGGGSKEELISKMEGDVKKLKVDLQLSRNKENDLRDQIISYMAGKFVP